MLIDVLLASLAILVGLFFLEQAAERFTEALGGLARRLHASEGTVGLLTAGGEWEELAVVVVAIAGGHASLAVGNVVGAAIANLIGSLPLGMLASQPLRPDRSARVYGLAMVAVTALAAGFMVDGNVSRPAGAVLIGVFIVYALSVVMVVRRGWLAPPIEDEDDEDEREEQRPEKAKGHLAVVLVISLVVIAAASEAIVRGGVVIGQYAGLSDYAIGATIVAVGTTLPDKAFSLLGGLRGQSGVVTANALGSNIFILTLILGIAALAGPGLMVAPVVAGVDVPLLLGVSVLTAALFFRTRLHRVTGVTFLAAYGAYIAYVLVRA